MKCPANKFKCQLYKRINTEYCIYCGLIDQNNADVTFIKYSIKDLETMRRRRKMHDHMIKLVHQSRNLYANEGIVSINK